MRARELVGIAAKHEDVWQRCVAQEEIAFESLGPWDGYDSVGLHWCEEGGVDNYVTEPIRLSSEVITRRNQAIESALQRFS